VSTDTARATRFEAVAADVFEPLQRYLARRARADDAADVLADAMLTIWRRLDDVPGDDPLPWCYGVARRCLANQRRGTDRRLRLVDRAATAAPGPGSQDPQDAVDRMDPELVAALATLTAAEVEVVRLWAWEALEPAEIAMVLDTTPNAVSVALSRARRKLRDELSTERHGTDRQEAKGAGQVGDEAITDRGRSER
jgi:RNA polymerase sigma-70 factor (ECF subfamily)